MFSGFDFPEKRNWQIKKCFKLREYLYSKLDIYKAKLKISFEKKNRTCNTMYIYIGQPIISHCTTKGRLLEVVLTR